MKIGKIYDKVNDAVDSAMYKAGKHIPEKIRNPTGSRVGYYVSIGTLIGSLFVPPLFYVGVGMICAHKTCEVTNEKEKGIKKSLEKVVDE